MDTPTMTTTMVAEAPSAKQTTWNYRWRGEETGEHVIEVYADKELYSITLCGPRGFKLNGTFGGRVFPESKFTGEKVGIRGPDHVDIARSGRIGMSVRMIGPVSVVGVEAVRGALRPLGG